MYVIILEVLIEYITILGALTMSLNFWLSWFCDMILETNAASLNIIQPSFQVEYLASCKSGHVLYSHFYPKGLPFEGCDRLYNILWGFNLKFLLVGV